YRSLVTAQMKKTIAVILEPGPNWDHSKGVRDQAFWDEHARFIDDLFERGVIMLVGPFTPEGTGALAILNVGTTDEARAIYARDPWAPKGILRVADAKEWTIFMDGREKG